MTTATKNKLAQLVSSTQDLWALLDDVSDKPGNKYLVSLINSEINRRDTNWRRVQSTLNAQSRGVRNPGLPGD